LAFHGCLYAARRIPSSRARGTRIAKRSLVNPVKLPGKTALVRIAAIGAASLLALSAFAQSHTEMTIEDAQTVTAQKIFSKGNPSSTYILQLLDSLGTRNGQLIGFSIEQLLNPSSPANYYNFGQATELFTASSNSQTFPSQSAAVYGSFNHFGSGALDSGFGASFEAFNGGPATATLIVGVHADATNGGVAAGVRTQSPTNNGNATNLRAGDFLVRNSSSGTVTNAASLYVEGPQNTNHGTITNLYGLLIQDQLTGTNNWAIKTGKGLVQFGGKVRADGGIGVGSATLISPTAPTISSGFGKAPAVFNANGTAAFTINVGTGGTANSGVIGLLTATHGWACTCTDITTNSSTVFACKQIGAGTTTTAPIGEFTASGAAHAWEASDILAVSCFAY